MGSFYQLSRVNHYTQHAMYKYEANELDYHQFKSNHSGCYTILYLQFCWPQLGWAIDGKLIYFLVAPLPYS